MRVRRFPSFPVAVVTRYPVGRWGPGALSARDLGLVSPGAPPAGLFFFFFFPSLKWELPSLPPGLVCPVLSAARLPSSVRCSCFSCFFFFFPPLFWGSLSGVLALLSVRSRSLPCLVSLVAPGRVFSRSPVRSMWCSCVLFGPWPKPRQARDGHSWRMAIHCEWRPLFSFCQRAPRLSSPPVLVVCGRQGCGCLARVLTRAHFSL